MWVEFVVSFLLCSVTFFSRYSGFPHSPKTNTSKFQFNLDGTDTLKQALKNSLVLVCKLKFQMTKKKEFSTVCQKTKNRGEHQFPSYVPSAIRTDDADDADGGLLL